MIVQPTTKSARRQKPIEQPNAGPPLTLYGFLSGPVAVACAEDIAKAGIIISYVCDAEVTVHDTELTNSSYLKYSNTTNDKGKQ